MENERKYVLDLIDGAHARTTKWLGAVIMAIILCWGLTIAGFVWYINRFDYSNETTTNEYTQDGEGLNIIGDGNGVNLNGPEVQGNG